MAKRHWSRHMVYDVFSIARLLFPRKSVVLIMASYTNTAQATLSSPSDQMDT